MSYTLCCEFHAVILLDVFSFIIVCTKNTYPKGLQSNCKRTYSCAILAKRKMCGKKFSQAMSAGCNRQITKWLQKQLVKNFCKLSCNNCNRKCFTPYTIPSAYVILFQNIFCISSIFIQIQANLLQSGSNGLNARMRIGQ